MTKTETELLIEQAVEASRVRRDAEAERARRSRWTRGGLAVVGSFFLAFHELPQVATLGAYAETTSVAIGAGLITATRLMDH